MRVSLISFVCFAALSSPVAAEAAGLSASFANRSLGLGVGATRVFGDGPTVPEVLVPLWFEASGYLEDGFEFFVRVPVAIAHVRVGAMTPDGSGFVPASGLQLGVRYLFLEEAVRPFVFLHLGGVWTFRGASVADNLLVGPGGGVGLEVFVSDSVSLQARAFGEWYVTINAPQRGSLGATVTVSTSF